MPESLIDILSMTGGEIADRMRRMGQPAYRAEQIFRWLHQKTAASFSEMDNLPLALRRELERQFLIPRLRIAERRRSSDGTVKYLFLLPDGNAVESVAMFYEHGMSLCVSSQVGCRMGCDFCASASGGFVRDLSVSEMLLQVYAASADLGVLADSVVVMGIGEPLDNFCNVVGFYDMITDKAGFSLSNRSFSLSTCGLADAIDRLADQKKQLTLSVSLHATTDAERDRMMPVNRRYNIARLMQSCRRYQAVTGRRVSFEYAVIAGVNDSEEDAGRLGRLLRGMGAHVNLIPANRAAKDYSATRRQAADFRERLRSQGLNATVRRTLGADIDAACGQLRRRYLSGGADAEPQKRDER